MFLSDLLKWSGPDLKLIWSWFGADVELMKSWWRADVELMWSWWRADVELMWSWCGADVEPWIEKMGNLEQKWGPNGDPKTEKVPMGTHEGAVFFSIHVNFRGSPVKWNTVFLATSGHIWSYRVFFFNSLFSVPQSQGDPILSNEGTKRGPKIWILQNGSQRANMLK